MSSISELQAEKKDVLVDSIILVDSVHVNHFDVEIGVEVGVGLAWGDRDRRRRALDLDSTGWGWGAWDPAGRVVL